jgi:hypothetical protein
MTPFANISRDTLAISFIFETRAPKDGFAELSQTFDCILRGPWQKIAVPLTGIHWHNQSPRLIALDENTATVVILAQFKTEEALDKAIARLGLVASC